MTPSEIDHMIQSYLPIRREKKDLLGEVFTPVFLIDDMLDKVPAHIWRDPELTWLDPAAGIGSFCMRIFSRLMTHLPDQYSGTKGGYTTAQGKRHYIVRHMLFMVELDAANVRVAKRVFGSGARICRADFLEEWSRAFDGVTHFDVIVGNPPFNASQVYRDKKGGGESLWPHFVRISLDCLTSKGHLLFVHPSTWRKPRVKEDAKTDDLYERMTREHQLEYLEIHSKSDGVRTFGIQTRYDWYLLKKRPSTASKKTTVKDELGKTHQLDLRNWPFLPNSHYTEIYRLLGHADNVLYSRTQFGTDKAWTHATQTATYKYPLIHSTPQSGVRYYWTSTKTPKVASPVPMFGVPKVVFGESGTSVQRVVVDTAGKYGLTQEAIGLRIRSAKEGREIKEALLSDAFQTILQAMSFSQYRIDWRMFVHLKPTFYTHFITRKNGITKKSAKPLRHQVTRKTRTKN
ncbi:MAG: Eco57I restriction-modification methylase domain-containing protein [Flavobacterium sp.]